MLKIIMDLLFVNFNYDEYADSLEEYVFTDTSMVQFGRFWIKIFLITALP